LDSIGDLKAPRAPGPDICHQVHVSHSPVIWIVLGSGTKDLVTETDIFWEEDAATILALPVHEVWMISWFGTMMQKVGFQ